MEKIEALETQPEYLLLDVENRRLWWERANLER